jgi:shikimate kinase
VTQPGRRHIVLVGLPGSGKTSVGQQLAMALPAGFSDPDRLIESKLNSTVPAIFEERGEVLFRSLESEIVANLLTKPAHVISPGGGWILAAHESGTSFPQALIIYLETSAVEVLRRLGGAAGRPVLGNGSLATVETLLEGRTPAYESSELRVITDGKSVEDVVIEVLGLARSKGGW